MITHLKKVGNFYMTTWLIFAGLVTFMQNFLRNSMKLLRIYVLNWLNVTKDKYTYTQEQ